MVYCIHNHVLIYQEVGGFTPFSLQAGLYGLFYVEMKRHMVFLMINHFTIFFYILHVSDRYLVNY